MTKAKRLSVEQRLQILEDQRKLDSSNIEAIRNFVARDLGSPRNHAADIIAEMPIHDRQSNEIIAALEAAGLEIVRK